MSGLGRIWTPERIVLVTGEDYLIQITIYTLLLDLGPDRYQ